MKTELIERLARNLHAANILTAADLEGLGIPPRGKVIKHWHSNEGERERWRGVAARLVRQCPEVFRIAAPPGGGDDYSTAARWVDRATVALRVIVAAISGACVGGVLSRYIGL